MEDVEKEFNHSFTEQNSAHELKQPKVIGSHKKLDVLKKENYGSIAKSILLQVSKNYERIIYKNQCCMSKTYSQTIKRSLKNYMEASTAFQEC